MSLILHGVVNTLSPKYGKNKNNIAQKSLYNIKNHGKDKQMYEWLGNITFYSPLSKVSLKTYDFAYFFPD